MRVRKVGVRVENSRFVAEDLFPSPHRCGEPSSHE